MTALAETAAPFDETLVCNRCGECCQRFFLPSPDEVRRGDNWRWDNYDEEWYGQLELIGEAEGLVEGENTHIYKCPHFCYQEGVGTCLIYDQRPGICKDFPYGKWVKGFENCVWSLEKQLEASCTR